MTFLLASHVYGVLLGKSQYRNKANHGFCYIPYRVYVANYEMMRLT